MTATGAALETKASCTADRDSSTPEMGAMTFPLPSTFSRAVASCSTLALELWIPASSWAKVESRVTWADSRVSSAPSISAWEAAPIS